MYEKFWYFSLTMDDVKFFRMRYGYTRGGGGPRRGYSFTN